MMIKRCRDCKWLGFYCIKMAEDTTERCEFERKKKIKKKKSESKEN